MATQQAVPPPSERAQVHRHPERGVYDRAAADAILDEALFCHLGWVDGHGAPRIVPTIHVRVGDTLYVHGSNASRTLRATREGAEVCVCVTLLDGLVLARSAFNHSMNYRSVVVYGRAREVTDADEKWNAQRALVDHVVPGRSAEARMPDQRELDQTTIMAIPLDEVSAKIRTGPPKDDEDDLDLGVWAGVLPIDQVPGDPLASPDLRSGVGVPAYVRDYERPAG
ncbi:MAG TPA: pyridoxamine 5'-phosphate oxidase family protein [Actinomycetota bacterium]|nr:pyridoxamine 5'-phosphate oxidase family protein [Actinomycetota bacterium]